MDALAIVEDEVRELIRGRGIDPADDPSGVREIVDTAVAEYDRRAIISALPMIHDVPQAVRRIYDAVAGFGELQPLLDDPEVEEVWINGPNEVFAARSGRSELTSITLSETRIKDLVERMLKSSGRRLDLSSPFVDAALPDGSRLHVVIPDITRRHWAVNIRKFISRASSLDDLVRLGSLSPLAADFLSQCVAAGMNVLVSGSTGAGKTTLLNCLASAIGPRERVVTVEEIFELRIPLRDVVGLQSRQANLEGEGEIPLRRLVKEALRMRPDRLIVGEVREAESLDMLIAMNSGLPGACTIHANSAVDALTKICTLPLLAGENTEYPLSLAMLTVHGEQRHHLRSGVQRSQRWRHERHQADRTGPSVLQQQRRRHRRRGTRRQPVSFAWLQRPSWFPQGSRGHRNPADRSAHRLGGLSHLT